MKINKRNSLIALALVSLSSMTFAFAAHMGGPGPGDGYRMAQELNLTKEQQEQVRDIMTKHRDEAEKMRKQHPKDLETKLSTVLSSEQLETFKEMKQKRGGKGMKGNGKRSCGSRPF